MAKEIDVAKKRKPVAIVPRLGPPVNLRPAGTHEDKRKRTRAEETKAALREAAFDVQVGPTPRR
jgi:hypothetical protein